MIKANAWSDDHNIEVDFDATPWFEGASSKEILDLAACDWRGDYPADAVAMFMADQVPELADLFKYLEIIAKDPLKKDLGGFECAVEAKCARQWIRAHRPNILAMAVESVEKGELDAAIAAQRIPSQKYEVRLIRTESRYLRIEVEADTERHARCVALDKAGDLDFFSGTAGEPTYDIDEVEEVET
jgi:hypothetical protein